MALVSYRMAGTTVIATPVVEFDVSNTRRANALHRLLPPGIAFNKFLSTVLGGRILRIARGLSRAEVGFRRILRNAYPDTTTDSLVDWEGLLNLDSDGLDLTVAERQDRVVVRLAARGGMSRAYYKNIALAFGYADVEVYPLSGFYLTVTRYSDPDTVLQKITRVGQLIYGEASARCLVIEATSLGADSDKVLMNTINADVDPTTRCVIFRLT